MLPSSKFDWANSQDIPFEHQNTPKIYKSHHTSYNIVN